MVASICFAALSLSPAQIKTWDRSIAHGVTFRQEIIPDQNLIVYGLRLSADAVKIEPALAGGSIYDSSPANGRATLTQIVAQKEAHGGINADFFQFGDDPGGDPSGAFILDRQLISLPGTENRSDAFGWSKKNLFQHLDLKRRARLTLPGSTERIVINDINARLDPDQVTLNTPLAKETYSKEPYLRIALIPTNPILTPRFAGECTVAKVENVTGRHPIAETEWVLAIAPEKQALFKDLKVGEKITFDIAVPGFRAADTPYVIGGGPELIVDGKPVEFAETNTFAQDKHPRSAVGKLPSGEVWYIVADGRQPQSGGASLPELAEILKRWGCTEALNLDGGGSSSIAMFGASLNRPSGGIERQIANAVVWTLTDAVFPMIYFDFKLPESIPMGKPYPLGIEASNAVFTAQGAAWIDQDGVLHPLKEGECKVTVIAYGQARTHSLTITP